MNASTLGRQLRKQLGADAYRVMTVTRTNDTTIAVLTTPHGGNQVAQLLRDMGHQIRHHDQAQVIWVDNA